MFDLEAPIVPGRSAAGVEIGQQIESLLRSVQPVEMVPLRDCQRLRFGVVDLWVSDGTVNQIGVYRGYRGVVHGKIGIGATIAEIEDALGSVVEDEIDNLIVVGEQGWCFEVEGYKPGAHPSECPCARVTDLYVFRIET